MHPKDNSRCEIIAEIAQAHDGSLGMAHAYIDAAAQAGADAVKFQTHIASEESTPAEPWRVKFSHQDTTRYDYWKRMEFTPDQWQGLHDHARESGLKFYSSPFSVAAVVLLECIGVDGWKIASGEVSNLGMLEAMQSSGLPVLLSSGMSDWAELDRAVARIQQLEMAFTLFQCTSKYPTPPEDVGVNLLNEFRHRYACPVGLSDHSGVIYPGLSAAVLGANALEVHVTMSREMFGPDVPASLTTTELKQLVEGVRFIETMRQNPVDKDQMADELCGMRKLFSKSVVARRPLTAGTKLSLEDLVPKKPGTGIPADRITQLCGMRLKSSVQQDQVLEYDHVEGAHTLR